MNRRSFLSTLSAVPIIGRFVRRWMFRRFVHEAALACRSLVVEMQKLCAALEEAGRAFGEMRAQSLAWERESVAQLSRAQRLYYWTLRGNGGYIIESLCEAREFAPRAFDANRLPT